MSRDLRLGVIDSEGHGQQMFSPYAYDFYEGLYRQYGTVARIYGIFGVSNDLFRISGQVRPMA